MARFERFTLTGSLYLFRELFAKQYVSGSMMVHLSKMQELIERLRKLGMDISEHVAVGVILASIPLGYVDMIQSLATRDIRDLTVEYLTGVLEEEARRQANARASGADNQAPAADTGVDEVVLGPLLLTKKPAPASAAVRSATCVLIVATSRVLSIIRLYSDVKCETTCKYITC